MHLYSSHRVICGGSSTVTCSRCLVLPHTVELASACCKASAACKSSSAAVGTSITGLVGRNANFFLDSEGALNAPVQFSQRDLWRKVDRDLLEMPGVATYS